MLNFPYRSQWDNNYAWKKSNKKRPKQGLVNEMCPKGHIKKLHLISLQIFIKCD